MSESILLTNEVRAFIMNGSKPRVGTGWLAVDEIDEPAPHLMFKIDVDKFKTFDRTEIEWAKTYLMTTMMKLRNDGIPCFIDKDVHKIERP